MQILKSHVQGAWHEASEELVPLRDPSTEEIIAQASSAGIDFRAVLEFARGTGGPALRELSFRERSELLKSMAAAIDGCRDELIALSLQNMGATRKDAKFDVDGARDTLHYYAGIGHQLGDGNMLVDGQGENLGRTPRAPWGEHVRMPRPGVAVHINAFNFPAWGLAEKAACAILAGMPVVTKPATSTALVAERIVREMVERNVLPKGALQFIAGSAGDLLDHLQPTDVLAFTGSANTALALRGHQNVLRRNVRVNVEADSLNAAVLAPDVQEGSETWHLFLNEVVREITQKAGQKCTATRRILVPSGLIDRVEEELKERLGAIITGNPSDGSVTMGPLVSEHQLNDAIRGISDLRQSARLVFGTGERADGVGSAVGKGYFFPPTLLRAEDARGARIVHSREVFGPAATLLPYDGSAKEAADLIALAEGSLVSAVYSNDQEWMKDIAVRSGPWNGRLYLGSDKIAAQAPGSGLVLPQSIHGGPGRAGDGEELGGVRGLRLYMQRVAIQGSRRMVCDLLGITPK